MRIIKKRYMVTVLSLLIVSTISFKVFGIGGIEGLEYISYVKGPHIELTNREKNGLVYKYLGWRTDYVTSQGCPESGMLRVQRDASTNYDTVSEGQAYGMLLAVLYGDQDTFNALSRYYLHYSHHDSSSSITNNGLMQWKINSSGQKISEFLIPFEDLAYGTGRKHDPAYVRLSYLLDENRYTREGDLDYQTGKEGTAGWVQAHEYERGHSSASDADLDAMAAYMMAAYRWAGIMRNHYAFRASYVMSKIFDFQIGGDSGFQDDDGIRKEYDLTKHFIRPGCQWGGPSAFNPSYFTPAWFHLAKRFLNDFRNNNSVRQALAESLRYQQHGSGADVIDFYIGECDQVLYTMYDAMNTLDQYNWNGLYPDWVDISSGVPQPAAQRQYKGSDRWYWVDRQNPNSPLEATNGYYRRQSYNCYYDAIRVPWRILQAWNLYGDDPIEHHRSTLYPTNAHKLGAEIRGKERNYLWRYKWTMNTSGSFHRNKSVDGYNWQMDYQTGCDWKWDRRDGFNINVGGQRGSITFSSMFAITTMFMNNSSHRNLARNAFDYLYDHKETNPDSHYYGNTLRLLSLTYLAGGFGDYSQLKDW